ncbi:4Fe-4S binding protein [Thermopolyspora sp. NPDC052614]|uniref:4Fe-4S binding protein n=1 Tax=Thermopolyspora sp. NPDC052614 TaxID=3155682 RepID=UPI00342D01B3
MVRKSVTQQYPDVKPDLPARSRGVIALVEENCTVCMLCARECPDWCIYIDSHKETLPAPEGGRPRARNVLDRFAIDFSLCMYCGICIEACPFDALFWSPEFEYAEYDIRDLLHEKDRLRDWVQTVPPPPAHEVNAEPPKEMSAATGAGTGRERPGGARPATRERRRPGAEPDARPQEEAGRSAGGEADSGAGARVQPGRETAGPAGSSTPGQGVADESASGRPARERSPRDRLANVRSIRPPGALPKKPSGADETAGRTGGGPSAGAGSSAGSGSTGSESVGSGSVGSESAASAEPGRAMSASPRPEARPEASAAKSTEGADPGRPEGGRPVREGSARSRLANVRSVRPPGALPKKPDGSDRAGSGGGPEAGAGRGDPRRPRGKEAAEPDIGPEGGDES